MNFWRKFREAIKAHSPDAPLIGEVLFTGIERRHLPTIHLPNKFFYLHQSQQGMDVLDATMKEYASIFDGLLDFSFQRLLVKHIAHAKPLAPKAQIQKLLDQHYAAFPKNCALLSFLDNHDMNRFLFEASGDKKRLQQAAEIQFAQTCPPIIYYGTEFGMSQTGPIAGPHGDLRARSLMTWDKPDWNLFKTYQRLIAKWKQLHIEQI